MTVDHGENRIMGDVVSLHKASVVKKLASSKIHCEIVRDMLSRTALASGVALNISPLMSELPYQQCVMLGALYPSELYEGIEGDYKPWFMFIEAKFLGEAELRRRAEEERWVLREVTTIEEAMDLINFHDYALNFTDGTEFASPYFPMALSAMAAMLTQYELDFLRVNVTADNVLQLQMVSEDTFYQIDLEGPTLQETHRKLLPRIRESRETVNSSAED